MKEFTASKGKSAQQRAEEERARSLEAYRRELRGLAPERERRDPFKVPALH